MLGAPDDRATMEECPLARRGDDVRKQIVELFQGRPGWRLEPRTTPGATPLWCFVVNGKVEFSVAAEDGAIRLYVMDTDQEEVFSDVNELTAWLRLYRSEAMQEPARRPDGKTRVKKFFEWG
jgi:hypothetical protein